MKLAERIRVQCPAGCESITRIIAAQRFLRAKPEIPGNRCSKNTRRLTNSIAVFACQRDSSHNSFQGGTGLRAHARIGLPDGERLFRPAFSVEALKFYYALSAGSPVGARSKWVRTSLGTYWCFPCQSMYASKFLQHDCPGKAGVVLVVSLFTQAGSDSADIFQPFFRVEFEMDGQR